MSIESVSFPKFFANEIVGGGGGTNMNSKGLFQGHDAGSQHTPQHASRWDDECGRLHRLLKGNKFTIELFKGRPEKGGTLETTVRQSCTASLTKLCGLLTQLGSLPMFFLTSILSVA